jgi:hypothetical protein
VYMGHDTYPAVRVDHVVGTAEAAGIPFKSYLWTDMN